MSTPLRLLVLTLVLLALAGTAATLQLNAQQHARKYLAGVEPSPAVHAAVAALRANQQKAFFILLAASLAAVVTVALVPSRLREAPASLDHARSDIAQMDRLARTTVAQAEALAGERAARIRTEETLHLQQLLVNHALEEKIRLGRDLHDGIIQSLYAAGLTFESARQRRSEAPTEADALLDRGLALLNASIRDIRGYIESLNRTSDERHVEFGAALTIMLDALGGHREVGFDVSLDATAEERLHKTQLADLLQIVREAASNALRHGEARLVTVRLHENGILLMLMIQDDGRGFDPQALQHPGLGLANLHARAAALSGDLRITSQPGQGTRLVLTFPSLSPS